MKPAKVPKEPNITFWDKEGDPFISFCYRNVNDLMDEVQRLAINRISSGEPL